MIQHKLQMDILWALFGTATEVMIDSISEQNTTSTSQVKGPPLLHVYLPLESQQHFVGAVGEPRFSCYEKLRTTELLGSVQQCQFVLLCGVFQYKPHQWSNIAKFIQGVRDSLSCFLTAGEKCKLTVPWLDPPLEENLYWPFLWCKVSSFCDVLHLYLASLLLFKFLFLSIFSFYFPVSTSSLCQIFRQEMMHPFICGMDSPVGWMAGSDGLTGRVYQASKWCRDSVLSPSSPHTLHSRVFTQREWTCSLPAAAVVPHGWSRFHSLVQALDE